MSKWTTIKRIRTASEKARNRVKIRWDRVRAAQSLADREPMLTRRIVERRVRNEAEREAGAEPKL